MFGFRSGTAKFIAVVLRKVNGKYMKVHQKSISKTDETFVFEKKTFPVSLTPAYTDGNRNYLFFEFPEEKENGALLDFVKHDLPLSVKDIDTMVTRNIVVGFLAILKGALDKVSTAGKLAGYILCLALGGTAGYIIATSMAGAV